MAAAAAAGASRRALKRRLFARCDKDGDGWLNKGEMREFAGLVGFEGSDEEWDAEYEKLCRERGARPSSGIPEEIVMTLLDDESDAGCYCTVEEIRELLVEDDGPGDSGGDGGRDTAAGGAAAPEGGDGGGGGESSGTLAIEDYDGAKRRSSGATSGGSGGGGGGGTGDGRTVFFSEASPATTAQFLLREFQAPGAVSQFWLFQGQDGRSKGRGVVQYQTREEARRAIETLQGKAINGRQLSVKEDSTGVLLRRREEGGEEEAHSGGGRGGGGGGGAGGGGGGGGRGAKVGGKAPRTAIASYASAPYSRAPRRSAPYEAGSYSSATRSGVGHGGGAGYGAQRGGPLRSTRVYVGHLGHADASEGALKRVFGRYGDIFGVKLLPHNSAIVRFSGPRAANAAEAALAGLRNHYEVSLARPNPQWDT